MIFGLCGPPERRYPRLFDERWASRRRRARIAGAAIFLEDRPRRRAARFPRRASAEGRNLIRAAYITAGAASLALAALGAVLPLMPTTVFVILAAFFFGKSSPRLERWLLENPAFGPSIRLWRDKGAISRKGKIAAGAALAVSAAASAMFAPWPWSLAGVAAGLIVGVWIWSRPEG